MANSEEGATNTKKKSLSPSSSSTPSSSLPFSINKQPKTNTDISNNSKTSSTDISSSCVDAIEQNRISAPISNSTPSIPLVSSVSFTKPSKHDKKQIRNNGGKKLDNDTKLNPEETSNTNEARVFESEPPPQVTANEEGNGIEESPNELGKPKEVASQIGENETQTRLTKDKENEVNDKQKDSTTEEGSSSTSAINVNSNNGNNNSNNKIGSRSGTRNFLPGERNLLLNILEALINSNKVPPRQGFDWDVIAKEFNSRRQRGEGMTLVPRQSNGTLGGSIDGFTTRNGNGNGSVQYRSISPLDKSNPSKERAEEENNDEIEEIDGRDIREEHEAETEVAEEEEEEEKNKKMNNGKKYGGVEDGTRKLKQTSKNKVTSFDTSSQPPNGDLKIITTVVDETIMERSAMSLKRFFNRLCNRKLKGGGLDNEDDILESFEFANRLLLWEERNKKNGQPFELRSPKSTQATSNGISNTASDSNTTTTSSAVAVTFSSNPLSFPQTTSVTQTSIPSSTNIGSSSGPPQTQNSLVSSSAFNSTPSTTAPPNIQGNQAGLIYTSEGNVSQQQPQQVPPQQSQQHLQQVNGHHHSGNSISHSTDSNQINYQQHQQTLYQSPRYHNQGHTHTTPGPGSTGATTPYGSFGGSTHHHHPHGHHGHHHRSQSGGTYYTGHPSENDADVEDDLDDDTHSKHSHSRSQIGGEMGFSQFFNDVYDPMDLNPLSQTYSSNYQMLDGIFTPHSAYHGGATSGREGTVGPTGSAQSRRRRRPTTSSTGYESGSRRKIKRLVRGLSHDGTEFLNFSGGAPSTPGHSYIQPSMGSGYPGTPGVGTSTANNGPGDPGINSSNPVGSGNLLPQVTGSNTQGQAGVPGAPIPGINIDHGGSHPSSGGMHPGMPFSSVGGTSSGRVSNNDDIIFIKDKMITQLQSTIYTLFQDLKEATDRIQGFSESEARLITQEQRHVNDLRALEAVHREQILDLQKSMHTVRKENKKLYRRYKSDIRKILKFVPSSLQPRVLEKIKIDIDIYSSKKNFNNHTNQRSSRSFDTGHHHGNGNNSNNRDHNQNQNYSHGNTQGGSNNSHHSTSFNNHSTGYSSTGKLTSPPPFSVPSPSIPSSHLGLGFQQSHTLSAPSPQSALTTPQMGAIGSGGISNSNIGVGIGVSSGNGGGHTHIINTGSLKKSTSASASTQQAKSVKLLSRDTIIKDKFFRNRSSSQNSSGSNSRSVSVSESESESDSDDDSSSSSSESDSEEIYQQSNNNSNNNSRRSSRSSNNGNDREYDLDDRSHGPSGSGGGGYDNYGHSGYNPSNKPYYSGSDKETLSREQGHHYETYNSEYEEKGESAIISDSDSDNNNSDNKNDFGTKMSKGLKDNQKNKNEGSSDVIKDNKEKKRQRAEAIDLRKKNKQKQDLRTMYGKSSSFATSNNGEDNDDGSDNEVSTNENIANQLNSYLQTSARSDISLHNRHNHRHHNHHNHSHTQGNNKDNQITNQQQGTIHKTQEKLKAYNSNQALRQKDSNKSKHNGLIKKKS